MKFLLLYFTVLLVNVNADRVTIRIEKVKEKCKSYGKSATEFDKNLKYQVINGHFSDNKELKAYYYCYGSIIKYIKKFVFNGDSSWHELTIDRDALRDWLNKLQHDPTTVEDSIRSCVSWKMQHRINLSELLQLMKCLNEKDAPVDAVSANYVDYSIEDLNELSEQCKIYYPIDQNLIEEAQKGNTADSKSLGQYYACYLLLGHLLDVFDGDILYSDLQNWFKLVLHHKSDKVDSALDKCHKSSVPIRQEDLLLEEVLEIVKCFADEKMPIDVVSGQYKGF